MERLGRIAGLGSILALAVWPLSSEGIKSATPPPPTILVSVDGAADWILDDLLARGVLPTAGGFRRMMDQGAWADAMEPIAHAVTGPAHATLFTGALPPEHGVVGNAFHTHGTPITEAARIGQPQAETIWEAAMRQGKRTVLIGGPFVDGSPRGRGDFSIAPSANLTRPRLVRLVPAGEEADPPGGAAEYSRVLVSVDGSEPFPGFSMPDDVVVPAQVTAVDPLQDGRMSYSGVSLDVDGRGPTYLRPGSWAPVTLHDGVSRVGLWLKVIDVDPGTGESTLYVGPAGRVSGWPEDYVEAVAVEFGFWPGSPDFGGLIAGRIDPLTFLEQAERATDYLSSIARYSVDRLDFDFMQVYLPLVDNVGHALLVRHPRQTRYDDELGAEGYGRLVERAYRGVDRHIDALHRSAGDNVNLVVVSDHGMVPVHTQLVLNRFLEQAGFVTQGDSIEVRAFSAPGGAANIYVNLVGREPGGRVSRAGYQQTVARVRSALRALEDPATGEKVAARVLAISQQSEAGMGHPDNSGDLWVQLRPGYMMNSQFFSGPSLASAPLMGTHGHDPSLREMQAIFMAVGPDVAVTPLGEARMTQVAATVAALLRIEPPQAAADDALPLSGAVAER